MNWWVTLLGAAIGAGLLQMIGKAAQWLIGWKRSSAPERREQQKIHDQVAQADQSIIVVARSRDALERDNERLRETMDKAEARHAAENERHDRERAEWAAERAVLRTEIDEIEDRLHAALNEVQALRERHDVRRPADGVG